ncbi:MAG: hypothetical protein M0R80_02040 [Proteobacteria bacterium]|jgi:hypothetical protein|nr:hypothetical protein [Pseudomonadota bacterium]
MNKRIVHLNEISSGEAFNATKPYQDILFGVINDFQFNGKAELATPLVDRKDKLDAVYRGVVDQWISIHNRQDGTDIHQVLSQGVYRFLDLLDLDKIKKGRDFTHKYDWHAYQTGPWIHLIKFEIIWYSYCRCLEYLENIQTKLEWIQKKKERWTVFPENLPKEWGVQITKFPDDRDRSPKVSMFIPPLSSTFGKDLTTFKLIDDKWVLWDCVKNAAA